MKLPKVRKIPLTPAKALSNRFERALGVNGWEPRGYLYPEDAPGYLEVSLQNPNGVSEGISEDISGDKDVIEPSEEEKAYIKKTTSALGGLALFSAISMGVLGFVLITNSNPLLGVKYEMPKELPKPLGVEYGALPVNEGCSSNNIVDKEISKIYGYDKESAYSSRKITTRDGSCLTAETTGIVDLVDSYSGYYFKATLKDGVPVADDLYVYAFGFSTGSKDTSRFETYHKLPITKPSYQRAAEGLEHKGIPLGFEEYVPSDMRSKTKISMTLPQNSQLSYLVSPSRADGYSVFKSTSWPVTVKGVPGEDAAAVKENIYEGVKAN